MNTSLAANLFIVGQGNFEAKPALNNQRTGNFNLGPAKKTTDIQDDPQSLDETQSPIKKSTQDFCETLRKKTTSEEPKKDDSEAGASTEVNFAENDSVQNTPVENLLHKKPKEILPLTNTTKAVKIPELIKKLENNKPTNEQLPLKAENDIPEDITKTIIPENTQNPKPTPVEGKQALTITQNTQESAAQPKINNSKAKDFVSPELTVNKNNPVGKNNNITVQPQSENSKATSLPEIAVVEEPENPTKKNHVQTVLQTVRQPVQQPVQQNQQIAVPSKQRPDKSVNNLKNNSNTSNSPLSEAPAKTAESNSNASVENLPKNVHLSETAEQPASSKSQKFTAIKDSNTNSSTFDQAFSTNTTPSSEVNTSPSAAQVVTPNYNPMPEDISQSLNKQLQESIQSTLRQGQEQITIKLNPPELGKVVIRFQEQDNQITGVLEVSKTQTRYEIEQALPQIVRNLQDAGVQIKKLEIVLDQNNQQYAQKDQSHFEGFNGNNDSSTSGHSGNNPASTAYNDFIPETEIYSGFDTGGEFYYAESGVNMLA
jgi:flagellar hook-length control protein FliK